MLHIFVDEAGVPGITTNFIIGFAFFPDENYKICVDNTKSKIKMLKGKEPKELHFHDTSPEIKMEFLAELAKLGGRFGYIHVQKERIKEEFQKHPDNNLMYNLILFYLIENLIKKGYSEDHITLYVDQRSTDRAIKRDLAKYLPMKINPLLNNKRLYVKWEKSHNSRGIQCADFICGSVYRRFEKSDGRYYDIIKANFIITRDHLFRKA
jgi:hypothetical protein